MPLGETLYFCSKYFFYINELLNPSRVAKFESVFSVGDNRIMTNLEALTMPFWGGSTSYKLQVWKKIQINK